jgi:hypothetical protein
VSGDRHYSEEEVEQILRLATLRNADGVPRERLVQMAAELGISADALESAEAQVVANREQEALRKEFDEHRRRAFMSNLWSYAIVNAGLIGMDVAKDHRISWSLWCVFGWGIGLAMHAVATFATGAESHEKAFQEWMEARNKPVVEPVALAPHVESVLLRENLSKLDAIRRVREESGASLKDAKDAVEAYERDHPGSLRA